MRERPPQELTALVERLKLSTGGQVRRLGRRARRLARGLPLFDSVWLDVLVQARVLTPFQAGEVGAGRGDTLRMGPYVLQHRLPSPEYVECYVARQVDSPKLARLAVVRPSQEQAVQLVDGLKALVGKSELLGSQVLAPITRVGIDGDRIWVAGRHVAGRTATEWMVRNGRFPAQLVLEIARQMLVGLTLLERSDLCHTDISALRLLLTERGEVVLPQPCLRGLVRSQEGFLNADLPAEVYDYVAPEQIAKGKPPSTASDVYACGYVWWHLLTGRPPFPGSSGLAKLRAAETARIPEVTHLAPDTPGPLAAAIRACTQREPGLRPPSMAHLADMLGPPTRAGKHALRRYLSQHGRVPVRCCVRPSRPTGISKSPPSWLPTVAGCLVAGAAIIWSTWHSGVSDPVASAPAATLDVMQKPIANPTRPIAVGATSDLSGEAPLGEATLLGAGGQSPAEDRVNDMVLPGGGPLAIESLELRSGQCVRGEPGSRPLVVVPYAGIVVRTEGVRFENIDFLWDDTARADPSSEGQPAVVCVAASRAEFRGCSFQAAKRATCLPAAVRWTYPADRSGAELALFSGQLQLSDCVLSRIGVGVSCETLGAAAVDMANVLHLGSGALVELDHCPMPDEPVLIGLSSVTLRNAGPLLACRYRRIPEQPGSVAVQAGGCALVTRPDAALLSFAGPVQPERILAKIRWTGEGSLVLPEAIIAAWQPPEGKAQVLDDTLVSIAGLVRSRVEFAGPLETGPEASQIVRWQAPLRSPNAPGIDPQAIAWPKR